MRGCPHQMTCPLVQMQIITHPLLMVVWAGQEGDELVWVGACTAADSALVAPTTEESLVGVQRVFRHTCWGHGGQDGDELVWVGASTAADSVLLAASDGLVTRFRTDDAQARMAPVMNAKNACGSCAAACRLA